METQENYQQPQVTGTDNQTVILDPALTRETDEELLPTAYESQPPIDPDDDDDDDDEFPASEDLDDEDFEDDDNIGLNRDDTDDLSLNIDDEELE